MVSRLRVAAVTHARKEPLFSRMWSRHYGALFGTENLFLYKDGDDWELPKDASFGTVVPVRFPSNREECDLYFANLLSDECARLLDRYDAVVRTDVDEFLVVDPKKGTWDEVFEEASQAGYLFATGLDVIHHDGEEAALDPGRPILDQRHHALVRGEYAKPCVITRPVRWTYACHRVEGEPVVLSKSLVLFHLAMVDRDLATRRATDRGDMEKASYRSHANWKFRLFEAIKSPKSADLDEAEAGIRQSLTIDRKGRPTDSPAFKTIRAPDGSMHRRWLKVRIPDRFSRSIAAPEMAAPAHVPPTAGSVRPAERLATLLDILQPQRRTVIVDVGASGIEEPPYAFLLSEGACEVWGFEPQPAEYRKLVAAAGSNEHYLPHALGDGTRKVFRITRNPGFSSTLVADKRTATALRRWRADIQQVSETELDTVRLDDLDDLPAFDLLKIDIQGGEVAVFENGTQKLSEAAAVITEAAAIPIYHDQPLLDAQMRCLGGLGFQLHKFAFFRSVPFRGPLTTGLSKLAIADQLTDGDAIFVRGLLELDRAPVERLKHLAILADFVFDSPSLALKALEALMVRGVVAEAAARRYASLHAGRD